MRLDSKIYDFWSSQSEKNIIPANHGEFPEGWDVVEYLKSFDLPDIIEIGSGTGRLCSAFSPDDYIGLELSQKSIDIAEKKYPDYGFYKIDNKIEYPKSRSKLLYTVLLHQTDEDIGEIVKELCATTYGKIVVAEIMDRKWRREGNPPVFNRNVTEYIDLFKTFGKGRCKIDIKPYKRYDKTNITILTFE